jgi:hypothetical protein
LIDTIIQIAMGTVLICGTIAIGITLLQMHRDRTKPTLFDVITSTDRRGKVRLDSRKCFEAGAFLASTWAFVFLTAQGKLTETYLTVYMGAWVVARTMRDREQRLSKPPKSNN